MHNDWHVVLLGKCLYLSGMIPEPMNALQDAELMNYGIGFTNIVARTTRGSADLTRYRQEQWYMICTLRLHADSWLVKILLVCVHPSDVTE